MIGTFRIFIHLNYYLIVCGADILIKEVISIYVKLCFFPYPIIYMKPYLHVFIYLFNIRLFSSTIPSL